LSFGGLSEILNRFDSLKIGVIGDFIADEYISGRPVRLSREAPIPIIRHESTVVVPGGAANTVNNASSLGASVVPLGVVGSDTMGSEVVRILGDSGVETGGIVRSADCETVTKTRILAGDLHTVKQQVARVDKDSGYSVSAAAEKALADAMERTAPDLDILIVSDYGYRTLSSAMASRIVDKSRSLAVIVDSHTRLSEFAGARGAVPNEAEAAALAGMPIDSKEDALSAGREILNRLGFEFLLITRGNQGMLLVQKGEESRSIPISGSKDITDVSGAGDTVTAVMAMGLAAGAPAYESALLANYAAGAVVMKRGTATVNRRELQDLIDRSR
jgi:rfaE bifunctional protein kinase chain/domain